MTVGKKSIQTKNANIWILPIYVILVCAIIGPMIDWVYGIAGIFGSVGNLTCVILYLISLMIPVAALRLGRASDVKWYIFLVIFFSYATWSISVNNPIWSFASNLYLSSLGACCLAGTASYLIARRYGREIMNPNLPLIVLGLFGMFIIPVLTTIFSGDPVYPEKTVLGYGNVRNFSQFAALITAFMTGVYYACATNESCNKKILYFVILSACWSVIFWAGARSSMLALIIASFVCAAFFSGGFMRFISSHAVIGFGALASVLIPSPSSSFGLMNRIEKTTSGISEGSVEKFSSSRSDLWSQIWDLIQESPMMGHGYRPVPKINFDGVSSSHAHNLILEYWAAFGFPIGSALIIALLWFSYKAVTTGLSFRSPLCVASASVVITFLIMAQFSGIYLSPMPMAIFSICLGFLIGIKKRLSY